MVEYLSKEDVADLLSTKSRRVNPRAVYDWVARGVSVGGRRVRLASVRLPSGMAFTREAVDRFVAELNGPGPSAVGSPASSDTLPKAEVRIASAVPSGRRRAVPFRRCSDAEIGTYPGAVEHGTTRVPVVRSS